MRTGVRAERVMLNKVIVEVRAQQHPSSHGSDEQERALALGWISLDSAIPRERAERRAPASEQDGPLPSGPAVTRRDGDEPLRVRRRLVGGTEVLRNLQAVRRTPSSGALLI